MPKSSFSRGQFFIISAIIILVSLVAIRSYLAFYSQADVSITMALDEDFIIWNIHDQLNRTAHAWPCPELEKNLLEFKHLVEKNLAARGYHLELEIGDACANSEKKSFLVSIWLNTSNAQIYDEFWLL